jgi:hypothetical protein
MTTINSHRLTSVPLRVGIWFLTLIELAVGIVATLTPGSSTTMSRG